MFCSRKCQVIIRKKERKEMGRILWAREIFTTRCLSVRRLLRVSCGLKLLADESIRTKIEKQQTNVFTVIKRKHRATCLFTPQISPQWLFSEDWPTSNCFTAPQLQEIKLFQIVLCIILLGFWMKPRAGAIGWTVTVRIGTHPRSFLSWYDLCICCTSMLGVKGR